MKRLDIASSARYRIFIRTDSLYPPTGSYRKAQLQVTLRVPPTQKKWNLTESGTRTWRAPVGDKQVDYVLHQGREYSWGEYLQLIRELNINQYEDDSEQQYTTIVDFLARTNSNRCLLRRSKLVLPGASFLPSRSSLGLPLLISKEKTQASVKKVA